MAPRSDLPRWEPRLRRELIARLYASDATGVRDDDLVDEVGIRLLARIDAIFRAREPCSGRARCPVCDASVEHAIEPDAPLRCDPCDWEVTWSRYHKTIRGKHLAAAGLGDFLRFFADAYPRASSYGDRMVLVDTLIHRYHWELTGGLTRPGATDLIAGKQQEVIAFLDSLTYGSASTPAILETREEWSRKVAASRRRSREKRERRKHDREEREQRQMLKREVRRRQLASRAADGDRPTTHLTESTSKEEDT